LAIGVVVIGDDLSVLCRVGSVFLPTDYAANGGQKSVAHPTALD